MSVLAEAGVRGGVVTGIYLRFEGSHDSTNFTIGDIGDISYWLDNMWGSCRRLVQTIDREAGRLPPLDVETIRIGSLELSLSAAGASGAMLYTLHLLALAAKNPHAVGAWLPRVVAGWREGVAEARQSQLAEVIAESEACPTIPVDVQLINAGEVPRELASVRPPAPDRGVNRRSEINVRTHILAPVDQVWSALVSPEGAAVWLGQGAILGNKGDPYHCSDGTAGVVRGYHPLEQLRVSWHRTPDSPPTVVEVDLTPRQGGGTTVSLTHERLDEFDSLHRREIMKRWQMGLKGLAGIVARP